MTKQIWLNLPSKNVEKSRDFFTAIGFKLNPHYGNGGEAASLLIGEKDVVLMLFPESTFKSFTKQEIPDLSQTTQVLFSIDAESRDEVDEFAKTVVKAGGKIGVGPAETDGWMYGFGFSDLDGHQWNVLYMDMSKLPGA